MAAQTIFLRGSATGRKMDGVGYLFVAFFAVPFLVFNIMPVFFGAYVAFTEWSIIGTPRWVGLENFREAFADEWARVAFWNILFYGLIIVPGSPSSGCFAPSSSTSAIRCTRSPEPCSSPPRWSPPP